MPPAPYALPNSQIFLEGGVRHLPRVDYTHMTHTNPHLWSESECCHSSLLPAWVIQSLFRHRMWSGANKICQASSIGSRNSSEGAALGCVDTEGTAQSNQEFVSEDDLRSVADPARRCARREFPTDWRPARERDLGKDPRQPALLRRALDTGHIS